MLGVSYLLNGTPTPGDDLRYGVRRPASEGPRHASERRPVVVWNVTRRCNLACSHCYAESADRAYPGELTTEEGKRLLEDLAGFGVPAVLFSGGEPLLRPDLLELIAHARSLGLRCTLSTNGTLLTPALARALRALELRYVGVSLDGLEPVHDRVRGRRGAFAAALAGIRLARAAGLRVGLRFTVHRLNQDQLPAILDLVEREGIDRCCIYHLAYAGRGNRLRRFDLAPAETRRVVDTLFAWARVMNVRGRAIELLTVDNHADGVYLYLRLREEAPDQAERVYRLLAWNGGNQSGVAIGCIDPLGNVHPDQFSWHLYLGNIRQRPFSAIWSDPTNPILTFFRERRTALQGRCRVCRYIALCNGNLRVRAERYFGDPRAPDPACYLTDAEIGITPGTPEAAEAARWPVPVQQETPVDAEKGQSSR
jgi:radical SAM protein with 4Fe4S-binding SPASM domain